LSIDYIYNSSKNVIDLLYRMLIAAIFKYVLYVCVYVVLGL